MVAWTLELDECAEQLGRLHELARLLRSAGYEAPQVEQDLYYIGEQLVEASPPGASQIRFTVRCRLVDGSWTYAAIAGSIVARRAADLVSTLDDVYGVTHLRTAQIWTGVR